MDTKTIEARGVRILYEDKWLGTPGGPDWRSESDPTRVRSVHIPLTPEEWCSVVMRETGEEYIGGCCGNASEIQSTVIAIFHEGGYADADALYKLGEQVRTHPDGFEHGGFFVDFDQKTFDEQCARWDELRVWDKLGLCYRAVADRILPYRSTVEPRVEKDPLEALVHSTNLLSFWSMLSTDGKDTKTGQRHANRTLTIAKMLPGTRKLLEILESNLHTWSGVAIVRSPEPTEVCSNGFGLCFYDSREHAEDVLRTWRSKEPPSGAAPTPDDFVIREVRVTTRAGLEFL
jgi:hypothetical protein